MKIVNALKPLTTFSKARCRQGEIHPGLFFLDKLTFHIGKFSPRDEMDILTFLNDILNAFIL